MDLFLYRKTTANVPQNPAEQPHKTFFWGNSTHSKSLKAIRAVLGYRFMSPLLQPLSYGQGATAVQNRTLRAGEGGVVALGDGGERRFR